MPAIQTMFPALGTVNTITLYDTSQEHAAEEVRAFIRGLDRLLSVFRPDSEISRFNALDGGEWMEISEDTFDIFKESVLCGELTDGAFDITAGPLSALWRDAIRTGQLPSAAKIRRAKRLTDYRGLQLDEQQRRACLRKDRQRLDLGGIAKGHAADRAIGIIKSAGIRDAVVNLGGTVGVMGRPRRVGIQDPFRPTGEPFGTITLRNAFAVTSGSYERGAVIGGVRRHHIIDPRSGMPSDSGLLSVTVVGQRAVRLDALATAAFVLGAEAALPLLRSQSIEAVFITETGGVLTTPGLQTDIQLMERKGA